MSKETKKRIYITVAVVFIISVIVEILFAHPHGDDIMHRIPGFDGFTALAGGAFLIFTAKKILAPLVQRDEEYYENRKKKHGGE